ncbi:MAG: type VI secretion system baseplate subunit TssK [Oscillospiraceae bacterium]|nr:type VI secretion system baseplate subunit TssK [Oscillospiraceae bacterium]
MSNKNKVVWSEGMFLCPQHFQQQERYLESYTFRCVSSFVNYYWGFSTLELDTEALNLGTILVRHAKGVLPDGTPFDLNIDSTQPLAFDFPLDVKNGKVCLVLPPLIESVESVIYEEDTSSASRFLAIPFKTEDINQVGSTAVDIQIGQPRFKLMLENDVPHDWIKMGMVFVVERQADKVLRIDREYIPPTLCCGNQENLSGFICAIVGLLNQRGDALAERLAAGGQGRISEVGDFLLLMLINRWQTLMQHLEEIKTLHPERLYAHLLSLEGELASFSAARRVTRHPVYYHDDLRETYQSLMIELRRALALVLDRTVIRIDLQERKYGVKMARVPDRSLFDQASFVLAAHADLPVEQMQAQFPLQAKIGPVEKIRDLVNLQLPGIVLRPLPIAPRELPYNAGYNYFELDAEHDLWKELGNSAGMALYVAGEFPGLNLECWAIRK